MDKIINRILLVGVSLLILSCQQTDEFSNYTNSMTRASSVSGIGNFTLGDTMAVWGVQTTGNIVDIIFNNQDVRYIDSTTWTYDNKKLWNIGSDYMFYGVFPFSNSLYRMSDDDNYLLTIPKYKVPDSTKYQVDLMISERRNVPPLNTVDMIFHHILSNVNVYAMIGDAIDSTGVLSVTIKKLKFYNVRSTGKYVQTGWNDKTNEAIGSWSVISDDYMNLDSITDLVLDKTPIALYDDYLMMPQQLGTAGYDPKNVSIDVTIQVLYADSATQTFSEKGRVLYGITGTNGSTSKAIIKWEPNYQYNYYLVFNPGFPIEFTATVDEWTPEYTVSHIMNE